jgi:hypothetical protein
MSSITFRVSLVPLTPFSLQGLNFAHRSFIVSRISIQGVPYVYYKRFPLRRTSEVLHDCDDEFDSAITEPHLQ